MTTRNRCAVTGQSRRRRTDCVQRIRISSICAAIAALTASLLQITAMPAGAQDATCDHAGTTVNCSDVPVDGASFTSGVTELNVTDGLDGTTVVTPGHVGVSLYLYGSTGNSDVDSEFDTMPWDTDGDPDTPAVDVVTRDSEEPLLVDGQYIIDNGGDPRTFSIGTDTYSGKELATFLADSSVAPGGTVTGFLTVDNQAPFSTTGAGGMSVASQGGRGGNGGCWTVLLIYTHCSDGSNGGSSGSVAANNDASITVHATAAGQHGVTAISQGGNGGKGGEMIGLVADAGAGGNGGAGGDVAVMLGVHSVITTHGNESHGVFARSHGGDGGAAGWVGGAVAIGDTGGNGGDAGDVSVDNLGSILTTGWNSHGIYAQSVGAGAGSGSSTDGAYAEGGNGGGESDGAAVTVSNSGTIETQQSDSYGIIAQSIGGGGGDGGGAGGWFTVGGRGGSGGNSGIVSINDTGTVRTGGDRATAIFAQSVGGGGGNGGDAVSVSPVLSVAVGGDGGLGGDGDAVYIAAAGSDIDTVGDDAHGILAQSVGGGGGNGGLAISGTLPAGSPINVSIALGGNGAHGGDAGETINVATSDATTIDTGGARSYGIVAQSIGGGGGNGGASFAGSGGGGLSVAVSIGGTGAMAGDGKSVVVDNAGTINTKGDLSTGIFTQSIGGGGGNGGIAGSLAIGGGAASVSLGGDGGDGGIGGAIDVDNSGTIATRGSGAAGIFAQSIGGGGGNGGSALSGTIGLASVSTTVGGVGGAGNDGGRVDILNAGLISTLGSNSAGVLAQSIGGGGGNGGDATSLALAGPVAIGVAIGGSGGSGGTGASVTVDNQGMIATRGVTSDGVFAQSIGGSGGSGGSATTGTLVFPIEIEGVEIPAISANVAVGGRGAGGGLAGTVAISNSGAIATAGFLSNGVFAQSVGGSGGRGGHATNIALSYDATFGGSVSVGGSGGQGGEGNAVTVGNSGLVRTQGDFSTGVFAQSIGGGGGSGGNATNISLSLSPPPTAPEDFIPSTSVDFDLAIGGDGGAGSHGGLVTVVNEGVVMTEGHFATGVMAQSVGGSGGTGGDARVIEVELTADPMDFVPLTGLTSLDLAMVFGGSGAGGGNGADVTVRNDADLQSIGIRTSGALAHGLVAQSVGGGGGSGGSAMTFEFSNADAVPEVPVLDDISNLTSIEMTLQGSGGSGGNGGNVTLSNSANIVTAGEFAMGVVAQSVAGGGGLAGFYNPHGISNSAIVDSLFNALVDTEAGLSFAGSVGGAGNAGNVVIDHTGNIRTAGSGAHGVFAQSAAGQGTAGSVSIVSSGDIHAGGDHASAIYAQSGGAAGNGNVSVVIEGGTVTGGTGLGAGVQVVAGASNSIVNFGAILTQPGINGLAIVSGSGNEAVENHGVITGSILLGAGANSFVNFGLVNSGSVIDLGSGGELLNPGQLAPGGKGNVMTTEFTGSLRQTGDAVMWWDLDFASNTADLLLISGRAELDGALALSYVNEGLVIPGPHEIVIVSAGEGIVDNILDLGVTRSAVIDYSVGPASEFEQVLRYSVDFAPSGLDYNQAAMGRHINDIQLAGSSELMQPLTARLVALPDTGALAEAYDRLSPHIYIANQRSRLFSSLDFERSMHSCPIREGDLRFSREGACSWIRVSDRDIRYDETDGSVGGVDYAVTIDMGVQHALSAHWHGGLAFGSERTDYRIPAVATREGTQLQLGTILKGRYGRNIINVSLTGGRGDFQTRRNLDLPELGSWVSADQEIDFYSLHAGYAYAYERNDWYLQPGIDFGWTDVEGSGFTESGGGPGALTIAQTDDEYLTSRAELKAGAEFPARGDTLYRPYLNAAYNHILSGTTNEVWGRLAGAPEGVPMFMQMLKPVDNYVQLGIGIDVLGSDSWVLSFSYNREFAPSWDSRFFFVKAGYSFDD